MIFHLRRVEKRLKKEQQRIDEALERNEAILKELEK